MIPASASVSNGNHPVLQIEKGSQSCLTMWRPNIESIANLAGLYSETPTLWSTELCQSYTGMHAVESALYKHDPGQGVQPLEPLVRNAAALDCSAPYCARIKTWSHSIGRHLERFYPLRIREFLRVEKSDGKSNSSSEEEIDF